MRKFLAWISAAALATAVTLFIANLTLFTAAFIKAKTAEANIYPELSTGIQSAVKGDPSQPPDPVQQQLQALLTPEFVQAKFEAFADQLEPFLRGTGPRPSLTLADLQAEAAKQGLAVPPDVQATINKDLLPPNAFGVPAGQIAPTPPLKNLQPIMLGSLLVGLLFGLAAIMVARHEWIKTIGRISLHVAIWLGIGFVSLRFTPNLIAALLGANPNNQIPKELITALQRFAATVVGGFAQPIGVAAAGFGVVFVVCLIAEVVVFGHSRLASKKPASPTSKHL